MTQDTQIIERLARMEEKQDHILEKVSATLGTVDRHETRIRTLENSSSRMIGMGAVIAGIAGISGAHILDMLGVSS